MTFVFKVAVVGAGTMGGEIAQVIAAADIPVVLKDVDQKFVDVGLQKAREVTQAQLARLVEREKITSAEVPGFVVNRILTSASSEIWRAQEEGGLSIKAIDEGVGQTNVAPMGPFFLVDLLGLDTVLHVAEHLHESYGDRFYVHRGMQRLVGEGKLGAKTGGDGFYKDGVAQVDGDAEPDSEELASLFSLKMLVE